MKIFKKSVCDLAGERVDVRHTLCVAVQLDGASARELIPLLLEAREGPLHAVPRKEVAHKVIGQLGNCLCWSLIIFPQTKCKEKKEKGKGKKCVSKSQFIPLHD